MMYYKLVLIFQLLMGDNGVAISTIQTDTKWTSLDDCQEAGRITADNYQENNMSLGHQAISWTCTPTSEDSGKIDYKELRKLNKTVEGD